MKFNRKQIILLLCDIILIQIALFGSFILRFEGKLPPNFLAVYGPLVLPILIFKIGTFLATSVYKKIWRYANVNEIIALIQGITIGSILLIGYVFFFRLSFPRSIILIDWMLTLILIGGLRFILKVRKEYQGRNRMNTGTKKVLIVGAGDAGEIVLREFMKHPELNTQIIGFVDDDPSKKKLEIHGVKVLDNRYQIPSLVSRYSIDEVVIAIPSASGREIREIHQLCLKANVDVRILPGVYALIDGKISLKQIREVQVEDLLGREPVKVDMEEIAAYLTDKTILISGGAGSIGSELCRQVAKFNPKRLIIFDICENDVYDIDLELKEMFKNLDITPIIGSIREINKLRQVFQEYHPNVVFHAAAHKHVPLMEYNPAEAIKNNIFGTQNIARIADAFGVERFVMISTDKAVNPTNIMGATKRVAEMIIQDIAKRSNTKFVAVRFGNVLGSRGSVIPLFKKQILKGGPITVTHPDITRFFMTIPEASQLVIQAGAFGKGGEVFVLDMGNPVKIVDLAKDLIELSGLKVGEDIEIQITGLRPGEKLYEELLTAKEGTVTTKHSRIMIAKMDDFNPRLLHDVLEQMKQMIDNGTLPGHLIRSLVTLVATYKPSKMHEKDLEKDVI